MIERMYTIKETAEVLRKSPKTVRRYIKQGILSVHRSGPKSVVISESELKRFMAPPLRSEQSRVISKLDRKFKTFYS